MLHCLHSVSVLNQLVISKLLSSRVGACHHCLEQLLHIRQGIAQSYEYPVPSKGYRHGGQLMKLTLQLQVSRPCTP